MSFRTKGQDDMEIKNICTFVKAAELGNFTKAAQELGYAQSTVTAQIQQLENELHVNLFERNGKRIVLSASGKESLQYAYQIIKYESMAVEHFSLSGEPEGELNIGIMETICASEFVNLFQNFSLNYHQVSLNLQIVTTHQALDMLEKGKFDLIFLLDNKISRPDMVTAREYPVDISFFCASGHPLASQKDITLEQLLQEPFILTEKGCNYREVFESEVAARGQTLTCITEIGYTRYIIQAVSRRLGIGLLPAMTLSEALRLGTISLIQVQNYQIRMSIQVIYSNKRRISLPLRAFLDSL